MNSLPSSLLPAVRDHLSGQVGIHYHDDRLMDLSRRLERASIEAGAPSVEAFARALLLKELHGEPLDILIRNITIGETFFCREKPALAAVERLLLENFLARDQCGPKKVTAWVAGCSTGEEAYTLSIMLNKYLQPSKGWTVKIVATDINPFALGKAKKGEYAQWAFRNAEGDFSEKWFHRNESGTYTVREEARRGLAFQRHNLANDPPPFPADELGKVDFLFCRNVLMYFSRPAAARVMQNFHKALADDGVLVMSLTENSETARPLFSPAKMNGIVFFKKAAQP